MPDKFAKLSMEGDDKDGEDGKKRQKRGGKGMVKVKKKESDKTEKKVMLSIAPRGKKKSVTVVQGLKTFGKCVCHSLRLWESVSVVRESPLSPLEETHSTQISSILL
jgi:hypothetical protein